MTKTKKLKEDRLDIVGNLAERQSLPKDPANDSDTDRKPAGGLIYQNRSFFASDSLVKASQLLSSEIVLENLLTRLMKLVLQNAGAEKGFLVLEKEGKLRIEASGSFGDSEISVLKPVSIDMAEDKRFLAVNIVRFVFRTGEAVVLSDAAMEGRFAVDEYINIFKPKSLLCIPIDHGGKRIGVLYLENSQATGVFTPDRLETLNVLTSQAAISIENANLYVNLENKIQSLKALALQHQKAKEELKIALDEVESLKNRLQDENLYLRQEIKLSHNFGEIIGNSPALKKVLEKVEQVASTDATVLILGETGTGKELIARAIHEVSSRKSRPLVKVNCAALPVNLIENELFGHEKGAFTGAFEQKIGRFELANGGTIFLDEIGELSLDIQVKLLRVLQEGKFERIGNSRTKRVDVRIISATNRDLEQSIQKGLFREDLFYRLNVFPILVPPLRDRKEDVPILIEYFISKSGTKMGKVIREIPQKTMDILCAYRWPGNVRELENIIERAVIVSRGAKLELGDWFSKREPDSDSVNIASLKDAEKAHIIKTLQYTKWRVSGEKGAAKILGLNSQTLTSKINKLGIKHP